MTFASLLEEFVLDTRERVDRAEQIFLELKEVKLSERTHRLDEAKRELHTIKGNAGMMGVKEIQEMAHSLEDIVSGLDLESPSIENLLLGLDSIRFQFERMEKDTETPEGISESSEELTQMQGGAEHLQDSVRIPFHSLDELVDLLAEMVIFRNRLSDSVSKGREKNEVETAWDEVEEAEEQLYKTLTFIQERVMRLRMVPLKILFRNIKRIVHDESIKEHKEVTFKTSGGDTPMDKALLEVASEALGHLIRNAIIHGIETPDIRESAGKSREGNLQLSATHLRDEILIEVRDDGRGVDNSFLHEEASRRNLTPANEHELHSVMFMPGVSAVESVDMSAGRGMGLSAVYEAVRRVGGRLDVESSEYLGSTFRINLPLTVSIIRALFVEADGEIYAIPLSSVVESIRFTADQGHEINHTGVLHWRDRVISLLDMGYAFRTSSSTRENGYVVIVEADDRHRALIVDRVADIREIVVKTLDPLVGSPDGVAGSTVLGDGRVVLILDPAGMVEISPFIERGENRAV